MKQSRAASMQAQAAETVATRVTAIEQQIAQIAADIAEIKQRMFVTLDLDAGEIVESEPLVSAAAFAEYSKRMQEFVERMQPIIEALSKPASQNQSGRR